MNIEQKIVDSFTDTQEGIDIEANNIDLNCITSRNDNFNLDSDGNLTVNSITSRQGNTGGGSTDPLDVYPIGWIVMTINNENPGNIFGGTWQSFGEGKVLVGVDSNNNNFNESEKTGGALTHTHISAAHNHGTSNMLACVNGTTGTSGTHLWLARKQIAGLSFTETHAFTNVAASATSGTSTYGAAIIGSTNSTTPGATGSASSLPPYITCYMWVRTD